MSEQTNGPTAEEIAEKAETAAQERIGAIIGSDLGKIGIEDPFEPHLERTRHAIDVAHFFGAPYIRIFSFFIPEGADADGYRDEVLRRTRAMVEVALEAAFA